ncbi:flavin reductase family protein [Nocardioides aurantiacus]|uniref:flavin reductase family protein n=1 Tax=Nocardioides aurantiacus TaxID=86796 RepID=UPI001FE902A2|nr:flavin reductase family protein [Nocardioides aurantiacus]
MDRAVDGSSDGPSGSAGEDDFGLWLGDHTPVPGDDRGAVHARHQRDVLGRFATGVTVVTAVHEGEPVGLTCQSFSSVSLEPPLVLFCVSRTSSTWPRVRASGHFCVNVLAADQQPLAEAMAVRGPHKFTGVDWRPGVSGSPVVAGTLAHVDCRIEAVHPAGDHDVVIGHVLDLGLGSPTTSAPLLFHRGGYLPEG